MPAFRIELRKGLKDSTGKAPLRLRISHEDVRRFIPLDIKIKPKDWNQKSRSVRSGAKNAAGINDYLQSVLLTVSECYTELLKSGSMVTSDRIKNRVIERLKPKDAGKDFIAYARTFIEGYRQRGQVSTWKSNRVVINKLEAFSSRVYFEDLTPQFLRQFDTHLKEKHGNNLNTRSKNLQKIKTILFAAIKDGLFPQEKNPFFQVKLQTNKVKKEHLRPEEIEAIEALDLEPGTGMYHARNYFMFAFYLFGMRFSDVCTLRPEHIVKVDKYRRCQWEQGKVKQEHGVLLVPPAEKILGLYKPGKFLFPLLKDYDISSAEKLRAAIESRNARVNQDLKKIQARAGIETHISFHIARHSITGYLYRKGWGIVDISKALGHSSIKQTEVYLRGFDFYDLDNKMGELWT